MGYVLHRLDADGDVALAAGPYEMLRLDARTGEVLARASGYFTDVEVVDGGALFGLHLTPTNPPQVALRLYDGNLAVAGEIQAPSGANWLAAYLGRVVGGDGVLYWSVGDAIRVVGEQGVLRDVALATAATEIGAIGGGVAALVDGGNRLVAIDIDGTERWAVNLTVRSRKLVSNPDHVVAWSGALRDSSGLFWPVEVRDARTGSVAYRWEERGRNILRDVALDGDTVYVLRSGYRDDGPTQDTIEARSLRDGSIGQTVTLPGAALQIDATSAGVMWVGKQGFGLVPAADLGATEAELPPFEAFLFAHPDLDPSKISAFELFGQMFNFNRPEQYEALLALVG